MSARLRGVVVIGLLAAVAVGGLLGGMWLGERASQPGSQTLTLDRPSTVAPREAGVRSAAGFSGFEEGALGGAAVRHAVASGDAETLVLESGAATTEVRSTSPARFFEIRTGEPALQAGDVVVVRLDDAGEAEALLRIPADLHEGVAR